MAERLEHKLELDKPFASTYLYAALIGLFWGIFYWPGMVFWDSMTQWNWAFNTKQVMKVEINRGWPLLNYWMKIPFTVFSPKIAIGMYGILQSILFYISACFLIFSLTKNKRVQTLTIITFALIPIVAVASQLQSSDIVFTSLFFIQLGIIQRLKSKKIIKNSLLIVFSISLIITIAIRREGIIFAIIIVLLFLRYFFKGSKPNKNLFIQLGSVLSLLCVYLGVNYLESSQVKNEYRPESAAYAIYLWRTGGLTNLNLVNSPGLKAVSNTYFPDYCEELLMWCSSVTDQQRKEISRIPRKEFQNALLRELQTNPFEFSRAFVASFKRFSGINYPLVTGEFGRSVNYFVATAQVDNFNKLQMKLSEKARLTYTFLNGFLLRPYVWLIFLMFLTSLNMFKSRFPIIELTCIWLIYLVIASIFTSSADLRYQLDFILSGLIITLVILISKLEAFYSQRNSKFKKQRL